MQFNSPEEVLEHVHKYNLEGLMLHIMCNNKRGYAFSPLKVNGYHEKDGQTIISAQMDSSTEEIEIPVPREDYVLLKENAVLYRFGLSKHGDGESAETHLLTAHGPSIFSYDKTIDNAMVEAIILDMVEYLDIRTDSAIEIYKNESLKEFEKWQRNISVPKKH